MSPSLTLGSISPKPILLGLLLMMDPVCATVSDAVHSPAALASFRQEV